MAVVGLLVDQLVRQYVEENMELGEERHLGKGRIVLRKVHNKGMAGNLLEDKPEVVQYLSILSLGAVGGGAMFSFLQRKNKCLRAGFSMMLAGGFSNLYDRFVRGHVVDYLSIQTERKKLNQYTFNLGDLLIGLGGILVSIGAIFRKK